MRVARTRWPCSFNGAAPAVRGGASIAGDRSGDGDNDSSGAGGSSHAGNGGRGGASGAGGNDGSGGTGGDSNTNDAGPEDAGSDSGMQGGEDPCPSHVMCNAACCAAGQVCKTATGSQIAIAWDFDIGGGTMHAVVGSTLRFTFDDSRHDVQLFPNQAAFAACNFSNAALLSDRSPYTWSASTAGDFYFGCSTVSSFGAHCLDDDMKLHVIVDAPTQACAAP